MPSRPERSPYRFVGYGAAVVVVLLALVPAYLSLAPAWRPLGIRLACALLVVLGCRRIVRALRRALIEAAPSPLDAPAPAPRRGVLDERFQRVRDDLVYSTRSQRYFATFLAPRLTQLGADALPAARRRRGPSLSALEQTIAALERRA